MCKTCNLLDTPSSSVQSGHEVPKLHGRKFPEALLDLALRQLEENPARRAAALPVHEVHAPAHGTHLGVGLHLDEHLPSFISALQLAHVLGAVGSREGGAHSPLHDATTLRGTKVRVTPR